VLQQLGAKKPPISQKVKFIDQLRIVARGGQGGGGSSALFGRTGGSTTRMTTLQHSWTSIQVYSALATTVFFSWQNKLVSLQPLSAHCNASLLDPTQQHCPAGHHPRAAGGSGAPGGSVVLRATTQLTGLGSIPLHVEAERGGPGGKQWMEGKKGADKVRHAHTT
jgi:hypothetical protein